MESLNSFKIYYLDKDLLIRTDCHAIVSFYGKQAQNKPSRVRWLMFCDYINGLGMQVKFEHIEGKDNALADHLSRLTNLAVTCQEAQEPAHELLDPVQDYLKVSCGQHKATQSRILCRLEHAIRRFSYRTRRTVTTNHCSLSETVYLCENSTGEEEKLLNSSRMLMTSSLEPQQTASTSSGMKRMNAGK